MRSMKKMTSAIALACMVILPTSASASLITWNTSVDLIAGGDNNNFVSQNGTFVVGFNGGDTPATTTIGDSTFTAATNITLASGISNSGVTVTTNFNSDTGPATFQDGEFNTAANGIPGLINSGVFGTAADVIPTVTLSGLTNGVGYEIQLLINDARPGGPGGGRDTLWEVGLTDGVSNTNLTGIADLQNNPQNNNVGQLAGDFIIGTFTADASGSQTFQLGGTRSGFTLGQLYANPNGGQAQLNAFQLRAIATPVPEPGSMLTFALISLAGLKRRR